MQCVPALAATGPQRQNIVQIEGDAPPLLSPLSPPTPLTPSTYRSSYLVNIRDFSCVKDEDEVLLLPGTPLVVKSVLDAGNGLTMIQV